MKEFKNKVAVITGAASGIGRALAERCIQEGMKVVLADIEADALAQADQELRAGGGETLAVLTDVTQAADVEALAQKTIEAFGGVHLLFNNAGVGGGTSMWESSLADWEWTLGVNLWGVIHGVRSFVPLMLEGGHEGHIVNTASISGLISNSGLGIYQVSKHAVVSLSEALHHELRQKGSELKVSALCPGFVKTRIMESERNRPPELLNDPASTDLTEDQEALQERLDLVIEGGMSPDLVAEATFDAIREEKFYILTNPEMKPLIDKRAQDLLQERNPTK